MLLVKSCDPGALLEKLVMMQMYVNVLTAYSLIVVLFLYSMNLAIVAM